MSSYADLRAEWQKAPAVFDSRGDTQTLTIMEQPVMEQWEAPYMRRLAQVACGGGVLDDDDEDSEAASGAESDANSDTNSDANGSSELLIPVPTKEWRVLEVGYGLGVCSKILRHLGIATHHDIIEANDDVAEIARAFAVEETREGCSTQVFHGFWQDICTTLPDASYDGIVFDVYPLTKGELVDGEAITFFKHAARLLAPKGQFTFYYDVVHSWHETLKEWRGLTTPQLYAAGFNSVEYDQVMVQPPHDCTYFWKDRFLIPIVSKKGQNLTTAESQANRDTAANSNVAGAGAGGADDDDDADADEAYLESLDPVEAALLRAMSLHATQNENEPTSKATATTVSD